MDRIMSFREPRKRYTTLRIFGFLCNLFGTVLLAIGGGLLIFGLYCLATGVEAAPHRTRRLCPSLRSSPSRRRWSAGSP